MLENISWLGSNFAEICAQSPIWQQARQDCPQNSTRDSEHISGFILAECSSTFDALLELENRQSWDWLMACRQSKGRGQYGRYWCSPLGNLCVSQILPDNFCEHSNLLPMLLAGVLARMLQKRGFEVHLKWPNDLVLFSKGKLLGKLGGLLLEQKRHSCVFGLGLNLVPIPNTSHISRTFQELPPTHIHVKDLLPFWSECSQHLQQAWLRWRSMNAAALCREIEATMAFLHCEIEFFELDNNERGILLGITEHGALRLQTPRGVLTKLRGSLRPY